MNNKFQTQLCLRIIPSWQRVLVREKKALRELLCVGPIAESKTSGVALKGEY